MRFAKKSLGQNFLLDKTVVISSHRLRSLRKCDQILVFSNVELVDAGSFDELRKGNDIFRSLLKNESQ